MASKETAAIASQIPLTHFRSAYARFKQDPITDKNIVDRAKRLETRIQTEVKGWRERRVLMKQLELGMKTGNTRICTDVMDIIEKYMDLPIDDRKGELKRAKDVITAIARDWKK